MRGVIYVGDCRQVLKTLPSDSVDCCITSPPYYQLRDYGVEGQIGREPTTEQYVAGLVSVFAEVHRVLKPEGTFWLNLGDSYAGSNCGAGDKREPGTPPGYKRKDLMGIPWRTALALQQWGWYLRSDIIWNKTNGMLESVEDRPTRCHEYVFLLTKRPRYYYDKEAIAEPIASSTPARLRHAVSAENKYCGDRNYSPRALSLPRNGRPDCEPPATRNARTVWSLPTAQFRGAHFATFPEELVERCLRAGCPPHGVVLDPFFGAGTVGVVALAYARDFIGIEINPEYAKLAYERICNIAPLFAKQVELR